MRIRFVIPPILVARVMHVLMENASPVRGNAPPILIVVLGEFVEMVHVCIQMLVQVLSARLRVNLVVCVVMVIVLTVWMQSVLEKEIIMCAGTKVPVVRDSMHAMIASLVVVML